jgi:hypothetical protein
MDDRDLMVAVRIPMKLWSVVDVLKQGEKSRLISLSRKQFQQCGEW